MIGQLAAAVAHEIRNTLINILKNAMEAMPNGGNIKVSLHSQDHQLLIPST
ncbi:hypothetical protein [Ammoniphilus sp. 3BR4]|uniref:hypothetical protein n=1 Tax=Ammoniphilus sp. 3BR4 TaxID=3158265 RepID=UPI0034675E72